MVSNATREVAASSSQSTFFFGRHCPYLQPAVFSALKDDADASKQRFFATTTSLPGRHPQPAAFLQPFPGAVIFVPWCFLFCLPTTRTATRRASDYEKFLKELHYAQLLLCTHPRLPAVFAAFCFLLREPSELLKGKENVFFFPPIFGQD